MGKKDAVTKEFMKNPVVFADAFNQFVYHGVQRIKPEQLRELDTAEIAVVLEDDGRSVPMQRYRDVLKLLTAMTDGENAYCVLGIENQSEIHYALPVKNGLYDFLQLAGQVEAAGRSLRKTGSERVTAGEFLSGMRRSDRLYPVMTLVIYFGSDEWDAPLTLREMYADGNEDILPYVADYRVNLICPRDLTEEQLRQFQSGLREVMQYIKYSGDKEQLRRAMERNDRFQRVEWETANVINAVTFSRLKIGQKEELVDMCLAIDQIRDEGREEGRVEGREEGRKKGREEGKESALAELVREGLLSIRIAAQKLGLSEAEFQKLLGADAE